MTKSASARLASGLFLCCTILAGCDNLVSTPGRDPHERPTEFSSIIISDAPATAARAAAIQVLKEHFRIDTEASSAWVLRTQPRDTTAHADKETPRVREMLSGRSGRRRQSSTIELVQRGPDVLVLCQVRVERLETTERTAFSVQRGDDRPSEVTAKERASMADTRTRDEWVNVGRDRQLEREILTAITERTIAKATPAAAHTVSEP